jgi:hypothetical protein
MDLPPKTLKQQIALKRPDVAKVPLSSARPITSTNSQDSLPGTNPKQKSSPFDPAPILLQSVEYKPVEGQSSALQKPLDSLPVLSAFQEFLDHERERTRKRMIVLSISYLLALVIIVSVSMIGGMIMLKRLKGDFLNIQKEVTKLQTLSLKTRTDADTLAKRISTETTRIRTEIGSSTDEVKTKLLNQVNSHDDKLDKMDQLVQSLQKDNTLLKDNLTSMQARWMTLTTSLTRIENIREQGNKTSEHPQITATPSVMKMFITPRGQNHMTEFRIPIPE